MDFRAPPLKAIADFLLHLFQDRKLQPGTIDGYELSDQEALTLHQVKAHDVRAFAASKAFQSGVSLEKILSACHWKSHNTFTQFYLKDVAWADMYIFYVHMVYICI